MPVTCPICASANAGPIGDHQEFEGFPIYGCGDCGTGYCHPYPTEADLAEYYRKRYRAARKLTANEHYLGIHHSRAAAQAAFVEQRFGRGFEGTRVLEIGCSAGGLLDEFRRRGASVRGIEPDEAMAEYARSSLGLDVKTGAYTPGDLDDGAGYDLILLSHVVEHFVDPIHVLASLRALLAPGGAVFVEVPNDSHEKTRLMAEIGQTSAHLTFFTVAGLRLALERAGFDSVTAVSCGAPAAGLMRNLRHRRYDPPLLYRLRTAWRKLRGDAFDYYSSNPFLGRCYDDPAEGVAIRALARRER